MTDSVEIRENVRVFVDSVGKVPDSVELEPAGEDDPGKYYYEVPLSDLGKRFGRRYFAYDGPEGRGFFDVEKEELRVRPPSSTEKEWVEDPTEEAPNRWTHTETGEHRYQETKPEDSGGDNEDNEGELPDGWRQPYESYEEYTEGQEVAFVTADGEEVFGTVQQATREGVSIEGENGEEYLAYPGGDGEITSVEDGESDEPSQPSEPDEEDMEVVEDFSVVEVGDFVEADPNFGREVSGRVAETYGDWFTVEDEDGEVHNIKDRNYEEVRYAESSVETPFDDMSSSYHEIDHSELRQVYERSSADELREYADNLGGDLNRVAESMAILKEGEDLSENLSVVQADASDEHIESLKSTFDEVTGELDPVKASFLASKVESISAKDNVAHGYEPDGSQVRVMEHKLTSVDGTEATAEDIMRHELGHVVHDLFSVQVETDGADFQNDFLELEDEDDYQHLDFMVETDGIESEQKKEFVRRLEEEWETAKSDPRRTELRPYQWANGIEFFAVSNEVYLKDPERLEQTNPSMKEFLDDIYGGK
jgi:hypothetical protein